MKTKTSRPAAGATAPRATAAFAPAPLAALQRRADDSPATARLMQMMVQRSESPELEDEELQMIQRSEAPEMEEEELQMVRQPAAPAAGSALPAPLRSGIERLSGIAMDDVQVHRNSAAPAGVGALAYAQGDDIHLAPGQERHLPHEAWHVVQQRQDRVRPTIQAAGVPINDDPALEQEADAMGARAQAAAARTPERPS